MDNGRQSSVIEVDWWLSLAVKWQNGGSTVAANNRNSERLGIGILAQGVCGKCRGTYSVQGCNTEKTSRVKNTSFLKGLSRDWNYRVDRVGHNAARRLGTCGCNLIEDAPDDIRICLHKVSAEGLRRMKTVEDGSLV